VNIPETIDLDKYSFVISGIPKQYDLYAVVTHTGAENSGHYTSTIYVDNQWYNFNDSTIQLVNEGVESDYIKGGYLYFYRKRISELEKVDG
jgi:ubiquitin C-terminal hydrolase